jgi:hypothetical protein
MWTKTADFVAQGKALKYFSVGQRHTYQCLIPPQKPCKGEIFLP